MNANELNCIWIGVGSDVTKETPLYADCLRMGDVLKIKYGSQLDLSGKDAPHLNFYDLSLPAENLERAAAGLEKLASEQKVFAVKIKSVGYFPFGIFFLEIEKNGELFKLHRHIVEEIVQLKGSCIDPDYLEPHRKYAERRKEILQQYGNPHVLDQFQPHITIGHVKNSHYDFEEIKRELVKLLTAKDWKIDNIHVATDHREFLKIFRLV